MMALDPTDKSSVVSQPLLDAFVAVFKTVDKLTTTARLIFFGEFDFFLSFQDGFNSNLVSMIGKIVNSKIFQF